MTHVNVNSLKDINHQIYFLGTMHIAAESALVVEQSIESIKPNCVMLELDQVRLQELLSQKTPIRSPETPGSLHLSNSTPSASNSENGQLDPKKRSLSEKLFEFLHDFQQELGSIMGLTPGVEMVAAFNAAQKYKVAVLLIDRPIMDTFQRMNSLEGEGLKEQEKMLETLKDGSGALDELDLEELIEELKQPGAIAEIIEEFTREYPNIADLLIHERNKYMVQQIVDYIKNHPQDRVIVVLGAGHIKEVVQLTESALFPKNRKA